MSTKVVVSRKEQRHLVWQSEGFVDQTPASNRRSRPPPGSFSSAKTSSFSYPISYSAKSKSAKSKSLANKTSSASSRSTQYQKAAAVAATLAVGGEQRREQGNGSSEITSDDDDDDNNDEPELYDVEAILKARTRYGTEEFLVRWEGYSSNHDSWEPAENLLRCVVFQDYVAASRAAARALRVHGNNSTATSDAPSSRTPPTPRKVKSNAPFATPQRSASSLRTKLVPGSAAGKSTTTQGTGPKLLTYRSPSKRMPHIWGQLIAGQFGSSTVNSPSSIVRASPCSNAMAKIALSKCKVLTPSAAGAGEVGGTGAAAASVAVGVPILAPASRIPGSGKMPASPVYARFAHHRKLQKEIFARRSAAASATIAVGRLGGSSLNERIAAVGPATPEHQPQVTAAAAARTKEGGLRPTWCRGACHWTNCLCTPPAPA